MDQETLVKEQIDSGAELVDRLSQHMPVTAAFWLKNADNGCWYLYIASEKIDKNDGGREPYLELLRVAQEMRDPNIDPFRVKLISADDAATRTVLDLHRPYGGEKPIRYNGWWLGGVNIDGTYLYPLPPATRATLAPIAAPVASTRPA